MRPGFRMHRDVVAAGLGEGFEVGIARRNHQMGIEDLFGVRPHRLDHVGAIGNVGHEMAVHDVEMNPVSAGLVDRADLFSQFGKIRRQNGGRDDEGTRREWLRHACFRLRSLMGRHRVTCVGRRGNADDGCAPSPEKFAARASFAGANRHAIVQKALVYWCFAMARRLLSISHWRAPRGVANWSFRHAACIGCRVRRMGRVDVAGFAAAVIVGDDDGFRPDDGDAVRYRPARPAQLVRRQCPGRQGLRRAVACRRLR